MVCEPKSDRSRTGGEWSEKESKPVEFALQNAGNAEPKLWLWLHWTAEVVELLQGRYVVQ